jgi:hypothetical protein
MKISSLLLGIALFISACAPTVMPTEHVPAPTSTEEPKPIALEPPNYRDEPDPLWPPWKEIRDTRYGVGLAVPCWWLVDPIPAEGFGGVMTIKNYDEEYFTMHSNKGSWNWPNGTLKLDIVVMEGVDPAKSDADAYMQFVDPTMTGLVSAEPQQIGVNTVTVLTLANLVNTNDPNTQLFVYRFSPDTLLLVAPIPQTIVDTPDFQAILASIVLTSEEQVVFPTIIPASPLIPAFCAP